MLKRPCAPPAQMDRSSPQRLHPLSMGISKRKRPFICSGKTFLLITSRCEERGSFPNHIWKKQDKLPRMLLPAGASPMCEMDVPYRMSFWQESFRNCPADHKIAQAQRT